MHYSALPYLTDDQKRFVLDSIPTDIPLKVIAHTIRDELFWKRICLSRWPVVDVIKHDNSWKQAFFEKQLEQMIHEYVPGQTYCVWIEEALQFAAPYVRRIDIKEMLPPVKLKAKEVRPRSASSQADSDNEESEEVVETSPRIDHLDLGFVIAKLTQMTHLSVQYTIRNVGLDFEWEHFQFTRRDCISFSKAVKAHTSLSVLQLVNSRVDCEKCRVLVGHLLDHPSLKVLNLSHNLISDWGARALGKLINGRSKIECLDLLNNRITPEGGEALGHALSKNAKFLRKLNLRLNKLRDDGAIAIAKASEALPTQ
ncbi:unnamed protein product [Mesocestoides corti]|uniref:T-complex-associated testis-expressed protein 1 n=1 Tax=Mesocestoides corti TaxID=53468 RepID=A0A0R3U284_MESCO|nr:unnamed protein product [Mesocestoides corti]